MQRGCNVSLRFPISGEPKRARLLGPDRDPFLLGLRLSCNLSSRSIASREVLRSAEKKIRKDFFRSPFPFFLFRVSEICRAPVDNLANFHPNKGDKRECFRRKNKSKGKKRNFCFLFSFFFGGGRRVLKFVENTGDWLKF